MTLIQTRFFWAQVFGGKVPLFGKEGDVRPPMYYLPVVLDILRIRVWILLT